MASQDQGKTDAGGSRPSPHKPATTKKPSMDEVYNRVLDFQRKNPDIKFTNEDLANAFRTVARRKQAAELMKSMTGVSVDITSQNFQNAAHGLSASAPSTSTKLDPAGLDAQQMTQDSQAINITDKDGHELGLWMKKQDVGRIVQTPNEGAPAMASKPASALPTPNSGEEIDLIEPVTTASSDPAVTSTPSPDQSVLSIRPRGDAAESSAPAPTLNPILAAIAGFAAASSTTGNRKAPPPALNLEQPSRLALKPAPNHYLSMVAKSTKEMQPGGMDKLEVALNWGKSPAEQVGLLKSPIAMVFSDNKERAEGVPSIANYSVEPIPQAYQKATDLSTDFTLETPLTANFAKEQVEIKKEEQSKNEEAVSMYQPDVKALFKNQRGGSASKSKKGKEPKSTYRRRTAKKITPSERIHLALKTGHSRHSKRFDMITELSTKLELVVEVCKYLPPADLLNLYSVHQTFHSAINEFLRSSIHAWTKVNCLDAALVYNWRSATYRHLTIPDPAGRPLKTPQTPTGFHPFRPETNVYKPGAADNEYLESNGIDTSSRKGKEKMTYSDDDAKNADKDTDEDDHKICRLVPTLKWYAMRYTRQEAADDILAHLARRGHRTPPGTSVSLLKLWKLMASPTNAERRSIIRNDARSSHSIGCKCYILQAKARLDAGMAVPPLKSLERMARAGTFGLPDEILGFTDLDLLRLQCFFLKLDLRFNHPIYGPEDTDLSDLLLGQRSLVPLRQMLFGERYRTIDELMALKMRYDLGCTWSIFMPAAPEVLLRQNWKLMGVPFADWGKVHLEYWGERSGGSLATLPDPHDRTVNRNHMVHVQELVAEESARRDLKLELHLLPLMLWGCFDWKTGRNLCPTEAEIYMPNAAHKSRHIDTTEEFTRIEILKGRWGSLTAAEQQEVLDAQLARDDLLRKWDNNQLWDPREHTDEDDNTVQLSYAVTQPITGRSGPPEIPSSSGSIIENEADDTVETHGPVTARGLELERMRDSEFGSDSDTDSEGGFGSQDENQSRTGDENAWIPKTPADEYQLPQSFKRTLDEYQRRQSRTASSAPPTMAGFMAPPAGSSSRSSVYCRHSPLLPPSGGAGPAGPEDPVIDEDFINNVLRDLEQELSDGDETEIGVDDTWDDFDWADAPGCMWDFLHLQVEEEDDEENDQADAASQSADAGAGISNTAMNIEETVEAAWAVLQEAEEEAIAAGYRSIQARSP
ncbi:hypothetical protein PG994_013805 [Apiospora phragmitis]|uniref:F-box domain-containing protein n=1 Tax=Apiospora phragmitis TaxID=2905665 RepID=A0ABR1T2J1_9PEZI